MSGIRRIAPWLVFAMLAVGVWPFAALGVGITQPLYGVSFAADGLHGYIAGSPDGNNGVLSWTSDGGMSWHASSVAGHPMVAVSASTVAGAVTAVPGADDAVAKSSNSGVDWVSEGPLLGRAVAFADMAYLSGNRRVVVGKLNDNLAVIASSVGGAAWSINFDGPYYPPPNDTTPAPQTHAWLTSIDATSGGDVAWAVGNDYTDAAAPTGPFVPRIYKTTDGGSTWTTETAEPSGTEITCVAAGDSQTAFIGRRGNSLLRTVNGGANWAPMPAITGGSGWGASNVNAIDAVDADHVVVVGDGGRVAYTQNATSDTPTWTVSAPAGATPSTLLGVHMLNATHWIVVGDHETILRTNDRGATYAGPTNTTLPAVAITSPATGSSLGSTAVAIEGTSTDGFGIGVAKVEVRVRRGADNKYWNTSAWVTSADTWIAADRTDASNGFDAWNKTVSLPDTSSIGSHLYLEARATDGLGNFTDDAHLGKSTLTVAGGTPDVPPILVSRVSGSTRYATAVQIAKAAYPGWAGVRDVIIAGGEDARQPDALTAAGLAGAYSAPVILVPTNYLDADSRAAIQSMPAGVRLHIVGGTPAVSTKVANLLKGISRVKSIDRVSGIDRYATAVAVATRMKAVLGTHFPTIALLTNGQNPALAFDPLIASAVSANKHFPVLLTRNADVPASTRTALGTLKLSTRYIVGGTAAVSESSRTSLGIPVGNRIAGADVQGDAVALADKARQMSWLDNKYIGFAAKIPDAATGGAFMGRKGGALLLVNPTGPVPTVTSSWVTANKATITGGTFVFGGPPAVADSVKAELEALLN